MCVARSFDRVSVDGQLSTNDTVILQASGASGVTIAPQSDDEVRFGEALDWALRKLALDIVRDGEGSKRIGRVVVQRRLRRGRRAGGAGGRELAAGEGRAARRRPELGPDRAGRRRGDPRRGAVAARHLHRGRAGLLRRATPCRYDAAALAEAVSGDEVEYLVRLPGDGAETEVFFSDLSHDYVTINADYTT